MNYLIIGDGAAGTTAAQTIRKHDQNGTITIISDDPNAAYYRAALTNYLIGELNEAQLWAVPPSFYRALNIERRFGRVLAINTVSQTVELNDGSVMPYDKLLIATGSRAKRPPFMGAEMGGVMVMRTLQDVQRVMNLVTQKQLKRAVIVGGGPLAMEWVVGLHRRGVAVSYLLRRDHLMRRTLDRTASDLTLSRMKLEGIDVRVNTEVEAVIGRNNQAHAVRLKGTGEQIPCELVGVAIGVDCNTEWLHGSAVLLHEKTAAVVANERLETGVPNVWAAGDVAQIGEHLIQLWEPARLQGRIAGANMVGGTKAYRPGAHYNATRLYDLDFASVGDLSGGDKQNKVETFVEFPREGQKIVYKKLFVRDGQLIGAILLGDVSENVRKRGRQFKKLIDAGLDVSSLSANGSLLDPHFDVRSWMQGELRPVKVARKQAAQHEKSGAALRQTQTLPKKIINNQQSITNEQVKKAAVQLIVNGESGRRIDLIGGVQIGRSSENQLALDDAAVSHVHAQLTEQGGAWYVRDVGSSNGTFVNGERVMTPHLLAVGDEIKMGETVMQFVTAGQSPPRRQPAAKQKRCPHCSETIKPSAKFCPHCGKDVDVKITPVRPTTSGKLTVQVVTGVQQGRQVIVDDHAWIGRDFNCNLVLADKTISGRHLELVKQNGAYFVRDWASQNGSMLNGRPLTSEFVPLAEGDTLKLGESLRLRVM